ncbi:S8 family serine peptidase [Hyalangium rubrum]|uniref:S8 family serine peptidase n=1 Tax=Hyalangium rubrum TaxID=3103134 RepID=A0ABU5GXF1_9BACT|nr:S8 family serine peptidase [Hyalangium sp. s54d21]MDY7225374.1 S8 family serine peptidase [Hyalangium sp. s54d21]
MKSWVKSNARPAAPGRKTFAALVLGPILALQGCTKKEEPAEQTPAATKLVSALDSAGTMRTEDGSEYKQGQFLVRFKKGAGTLAASLTHARLGARVLRTYRNQPELQLVQLNVESVKDGLSAYMKDPNVERVEPNWVYRIVGAPHANALPNDARLGDLWGMHNTGQSGGVADTDINAPEAWDITTGSSTAGVITVIDTGVDYTHPDLAANMWTNPGEIAGNGVDDDNNGYVDDIHGINAITGTGNPMDDNDHGSHCSGTIAGHGNNGVGVAGVNWTAQIMGCKFLDAGGSGSLADAITCFDYVHEMKTRANNPVNIIATSNSWGGGGFSQEMLDGIIEHRNDGMLFLAAAGNAGANNDTTTAYPNGYFVSNVIAVAAHDRSNALASFSSYGRRTVHIAAPGVDVLSSIPGGYDFFDGTSMATPHVSGLVALLKAQDPSRDWRQLKNLVLAGGVTGTAYTTKTLTGKRLRAADTDGKGSMTCNNQIFATRARPIADTVSVGVYDPVQLVAYNVNCANPVGTTTVTVAPSGETVTLTDSGQYGDEVAGDGMYTGYFEPGTAGSHTLTFPGGDTLVVNAVQSYVKSSVPYVWREITGTSLAQTDDTVSTITSPFPIPFAGGAGLTALRVGMNGFVNFDASASPSWTNAALPQAASQTLAAIHWDDLYPGTNATTENVFWAVTGTAPTRELVIEWRNVHHRDTRTGTNPLRFQMVFFEGSPNILYNYQDVEVGSASLDKGASATVGVQVGSSAAVQHSYNTPSLANNTAYLWSMTASSQAPVVTAIAVSPATVTEGDTVNVEATFSDPDGDTDGPWKVQIDTDFPGWFTPDIEQNAASQGTASGSAIVRASGEVTVAVRVQDKNGVRSTVQKQIINVQDVPPTIGALAVSGPANEKQGVTLTTSFTDPGLDSPWRVEWDLNYDGTTFSADATSTASEPGNVSLTHGFANDGTFTVAARVVDANGVVSTNVQTLEVTVADLAPSLTGIAGTTELVEGGTLALSASFTNPGDNSKPWKIQWDFDYDGTTFDVDEEEERATDGAITLSRFARDAGELKYALRIVDADGSVSQVQALDMNIAEAYPVLSPLQSRVLSGGGMEPSAVAFDLSAVSGAEQADADPITGYLWDFDGDGAFDYASSTPIALNIYRDNAPNGPHKAKVRVLDEDGYSETELDVNITNVAPTLNTPASINVEAGSLLAVRLAGSDVGSDTLTYSVTGAPEGLSVTSDGLLLWTPRRNQANGSGRSYNITVTVTDDDGASASKQITLLTRWTDTDNDGIADSWEQEHGLNPSIDDSLADTDGDGVSNMAEFLSENGGPRLPQNAEAAGPLSGDEVKGTEIVLLARNVANKGDLTNVKYQFQMFSDAGLGTKVRDVVVDQAAGETTSATITDGEGDQNLEDNHTYSWRVRATDGELFGGWSEVQRVKFNPAEPADGIDGKDGKDGKDGVDGKDGSGCSAGAGAMGGMLPLLVMAMGLLGRRRRNS